MSVPVTEKNSVERSGAIKSKLPLGKVVVGTTESKIVNWALEVGAWRLDVGFWTLDVAPSVPV